MNADEYRFLSEIALERERKLEKATELLRRLVEAADDPCVYDHHGYCQAHGLHEEPCPVAEGRRLLGLPVSPESRDVPKGQEIPG